MGTVNAEWFALAASKLDYCEATGTLKWKTGGTGRRSDLVAGYPRPEGRMIRIGSAKANRVVAAHEIIYFIKVGDVVPAGQRINHKNGNRADNRWQNLKLEDIKTSKGVSDE